MRILHFVFRLFKYRGPRFLFYPQCFSISCFNMAENTKMEVEANVNETLPEEESQEKDEIMGEGVEGEDGSSDSEDSDADEAVVDPKIQQLELQVTSCVFLLASDLVSCAHAKKKGKKKNTVFITLRNLTIVSQQFCYLCTALQCN